MAENTSQFKLKVDPKSLHSKPEAAPAQTHSATAKEPVEAVALKKDRIPEVIPAAVPEPQVSTTPVREPVGYSKKKSQTKTKAEVEYRKRVVKSIFLLLLVLSILSAIFTGVVSVYLLTRIIENPARGYTLKTALIRCKQASSAGEKWEIISKAFDSISAPSAAAAKTDADDENSDYQNTGGYSYSDPSPSPGTFGRIKRRAESTARSAQGRAE